MKNVHLIGNAHLDPVWLWQWQEGYQEVKATFRSALDRMDENPDFVFTCACAAYYQWVEENAPDMFEQIRRRVAEGRWKIVGGMWIQPDCNQPSGESMCRQLLLSQRYFAEKFGLTVTCGYNVDTFGHGAMLPQLLRRAGISRYVWMRPGMAENASIPEGAMIWEAPDGSRVTAYRIPDGYGADRNVSEKIARIGELSERLGTPQMCFYGVGNHGGGPTVANLREIDAFRAQSPDGGRAFYSSPDRYFDDLEACGARLPVWKGELQHHASGCYSTNSRTKLLNRLAESGLTRAEKFSVLAFRLTGHRARAQALRQAWENVLFNQFHDVAGGCCIRPAMEDAALQLGEAVSIAAREENAALQRVSWSIDTSMGDPRRLRSKEDSFWLWSCADQGTPVVVFNPHPFPVTATVRLHPTFARAADPDGAPLPVQRVRADRTNGSDCFSSIFRGTVPGLGYKVFWVFGGEPAPCAPSEVRAEGCVLENGLLRAEFDPRSGALLHLVSKKTGRDALRGPAVPLLVDNEAADTWAHMVFRFDREAGTFGDAEIRVLESGPVRAAIEVRTSFRRSTLRQRWTLTEGCDQLEAEAFLHFHEGFRMLKLAFPAACRDPRAFAEIGYGVIERPANGDEETCQRFCGVFSAEGGLCLISEGKNSVSTPGSELRLTVANSSLFADHYGQEHRDGYCEFQDQGEQRIRYAVVPFDGAWQDADLDRRAAVFCQPLPHVTETYHEGPLPQAYTGMTIGAPGLELGALKRAEDGSGWILRIAECRGRAVRSSVSLPLLGRTVEAAWTPFEVKTLLVPDDPALPTVPVLITEFPED